MLNCNAVTTETSAHLMGNSEARTVHQSDLHLKRGLVIGYRLDLGQGCNFGKDSSLWPRAIPRESLSNKPTLASRRRVPPSQLESGSAPPYPLHASTQGMVGNQLWVNCSNADEFQLRKIQSKEWFQTLFTSNFWKWCKTHCQRQSPHIWTHPCPSLVQHPVLSSHLCWAKQLGGLRSQTSDHNNSLSLTIIKSTTLHSSVI